MQPLFVRDLVVVVLGSGSRGNTTYVGDGERGLLIDCGLSNRQVRRRLEAVGLEDAPIDAVLVTHEHTDHVAAAGVLDRAEARRHGGRSIPFWMTAGTRDRLPDRVRPTRIEVARAGAPIAWEGWSLRPVRVPHDTPDPVAWTIEAHGVRVGVLTDLGHTPALLTRTLATLDVAVLEFNHDVEMLMDGPYPWPLKQRIRGRHGHLSNAQAASMLVDSAPERLQHLVLAHLSEENNAPDAALRACTQALHAAGCHGLTVQVASQREPIDPIRMEARSWSLGPSPRRRRSSTASPPVEPAGRQPALFPTAGDA